MTSKKHRKRAKRIRRTTRDIIAAIVAPIGVAAINAMNAEARAKGRKVLPIWVDAELTTWLISFDSAHPPRKHLNVDPTELEGLPTAVARMQRLAELEFHIQVPSDVAEQMCKLATALCGINPVYSIPEIFKAYVRHMGKGDA